MREIRWRHVVILVAAVALAWPTMAAAKRPILFVHGFSLGAPFSSVEFGLMHHRFEQAGWTDAELSGMDYNSTRSNVDVARDVRRRVLALSQESGGRKISVITHSMGGLPTRWCLKFYDACRHHVAAWVSLAGPNHGTRTAALCAVLQPCRQMLPGSRFLGKLNAGDETPGRVAYATWRSPCDHTIDPEPSVAVAGAVNNELACVSHLAFVTDSEVFAQVERFVSR
jgi:triacylglycerol lipase